MKKNILFPVAVLALGAGFAAGALWPKGRPIAMPPPTGNSEEPASQQTPRGSAVLMGKIQAVKSEQAGQTLTLRLVEWVSGHDAAGQAALEAETCTLERLENYECTPNGFFIRETQKDIALQLSQSVQIQVLSQGPSGEIKQDAEQNTLPRDISLTDLQKMLAMPDFARQTPFIITTTHGVITKIQQQYVP